MSRRSSGVHSSLQHRWCVVLIMHANPQGMLAIEGGVDITNPKTLSRHGLWDGVTQVVCAVGPVFGRLPNGKMGSVSRSF